MRIACFLFDPSVGGPHVRARAVYQRMRQAGHQPRVVIPAGEGNAQSYHESAGVPVDRLEIRKPVSPSKVRDFLAYLIALPLGVCRAARYLRRTRPDVVHVNGAYDLVPALAARLVRVPLVWHLNDTAMPRRLSRVFGRIVEGVATLPVAAAEAVAAHYGLSPDQVEVIYAPVDMARFDSVGHQQATGGRPWQVGLVANWNPIKGQDRFIEVIHALRERGHDVEATMIGSLGPRQEGYWSPLLATLESERSAGVFTIQGYVEDVPRALRQMDLTLLTSRSEACPISVLESMAAGIPQVCFRVGGVDELLGSGSDSPVGVSVVEGDVPAMVEAVERVLTDRDLYERLGRGAPERARARFSVEVCARRHETVYTKAMQMKRKTA